jgi:hypothetical protein
MKQTPSANKQIPPGPVPVNNISRLPGFPVIHTTIQDHAGFSSFP